MRRHNQVQLTIGFVLYLALSPVTIKALKALVWHLSIDNLKKKRVIVEEQARMNKPWDEQV